jgi:hypothetical protein
MRSHLAGFCSGFVGSVIPFHLLPKRNSTRLLGDVFLLSPFIVVENPIAEAGVNAVNGTPQ